MFLLKSSLIFMIYASLGLIQCQGNDSSIEITDSTNSAYETIDLSLDNNTVRGMIDNLYNAKIKYDTFTRAKIHAAEYTRRCKSGDGEMVGPCTYIDNIYLESGKVCRVRVYKSDQAENCCDSSKCTFTKTISLSHSVQRTTGWKISAKGMFGNVAQTIGMEVSPEYSESKTVTDETTNTFSAQNEKPGGFRYVPYTDYYYVKQLARVRQLMVGTSNQMLRSNKFRLDLTECDSQGIAFQKVCLDKPCARHGNALVMSGAMGVCYRESEINFIASPSYGTRNQLTPVLQDGKHIIESGYEQNSCSGKPIDDGNPIPYCN